MKYGFDFFISSLQSNVRLEKVISLQFFLFVCLFMGLLHV